MYAPDYAGPDTLGRRDEAIAGKSGFSRTDRARPEKINQTEWGKQARNWPACLTHPPALILPNVRREWVEASLTLAGAVLGWLTPLLLKQVDCGPTVNFYHYGEDILCPLFACFGAALGLMSGVLQRSR
jgi:hypothetical protein